MKYLFLDTNSFIEFQPFESIKWSEICGESEYTLVISPVVIREINKHKDSSKGRKRERARKARKRIIEIAKKEKLSRHNILFAKNPSKAAFENPHFNKEIADDWLIFSALEFDVDLDSKYIITNDAGIYLIAEEFGLKTLAIPDKYLAPSDLTDEEIQIKELKKRLAQIEESQPHVVLSFADGLSELILNKVDIPDIESRIDSYREELRQQYPYKYKGRHNVLTIPHPTDFLYSEKDYDNYNELIEPYIENEPHNMVYRDMARFVNDSVIPLRFQLLNKGASPSGFLTISIKFSDSAIILSYDKSRSSFKLRDTKEPELKSSLIPSFDINMYAPIGKYYDSASKDNTLVMWDIEKSIDTVNPIFLNSNPINQNMPPVDFADEEFYVYLGIEQEFEIDWEVIDPALPNKIAGKLLVKIQ